MNIWESTVLTDKGAALQAKFVDGQTLQITRVMTGAVKVPVVNLRQQTSVTDGGKEITLQPSRIEGDKMIVPVLLENKELEKGYDLWQVGIYAQDPDEGEILYCLAQASEAKHIPSVAEAPGFSITWDFCFKTSNTVPFEIHLNSVGLVNIEQYQVHTAEIGSLKSSLVDLDGRIEELNLDLGYDSKNYTNSIFENGNCIVEKSGNIVSITLNFTSAQNIAAKTVTQLFTLEDKYKPNSRKIYYFHNGYISYIVIIEKTGLVQLQLLSEQCLATTWVYGTCTYIVQ